MRKMRIRPSKLFKNKMVALALLACGWLVGSISDGDYTAFVLLAMFAIPLFFAKENYIQ